MSKQTEQRKQQILSEIYQENKNKVPSEIFSAKRPSRLPTEYRRTLNEALRHNDKEIGQVIETHMSELKNLVENKREITAKVYVKKLYKILTDDSIEPFQAKAIIILDCLLSEENPFGWRYETITRQLPEEAIERGRSHSGKVSGIVRKEKKRKLQQKLKKKTISQTADLIKEKTNISEKKAQEISKALQHKINASPKVERFIKIVIYPDTWRKIAETHEKSLEAKQGGAVTITVDAYQSQLKKIAVFDPEKDTDEHHLK